jgi:two-component system cell cycle sensor histidine kinase/response regulator CckA
MVNLENNMEKEEYIEQEILKLFQSWGSIILPAAAMMIGLLILLDYFVAPEHFATFLFFRVVGIVSFIGLFLLNRKKINKNLQLSITVTATIIVSLMIEVMILATGGHQSTYYAGMIISFIFIIGLLPISLNTTIILASIIYAIYLVPILYFDTIANLKIFLNNNLFLISIFLIGFVWRHVNQQLLIKKLALEYDLSRDKEKLQMYSQQLEDIVQERTKELSISEKWHRSIFDNATDGIMVLDKNGVIMNVNQKACEIHGFEKDALIGVNTGLLESGDKEKHDDRMSRILNGETLIFETEHYKKDGSKILLEVSSKALNIGGDTFIQSFYRDITEKKKIQEQLMHSQKMESVGSLAGGIAHNFNNILTAILGYSELLLEFSNLDGTSKQRVQNIESSARKAGVMVSKLLSFARRDAHEVLPLNLNDVISDSIKLFEGVLNKRIGLKVDLSANVSPIEGDPNQLEQVIMNLMVNARDAMPDGGLITVRTAVAELGKSDLDIPADIEPGKYVTLSVSDTGSGIPKEIMGRIFDPFFTTKEKGKGTGLGLATVYGIVKDHKGYISVHSEVGKGTSFDIYLPSSSKPAYRISPPQSFAVEGNENILVIDDDRDVLNFIRDILESHGYTVITVNNPLTAVDTFRNLAARIQLVITDVMMPLMEGSELIKNLRTIKANTKIVVVSGYGNEAIQKEKLADAFIKKPFEGIELLSTVRKLLDTEARRSPLY